MTADFCGVEVLIPFNVVKNYDAELRFVSILKNLQPSQQKTPYEKAYRKQTA